MNTSVQVDPAASIAIVTALSEGIDIFGRYVFHDICSTTNQIACVVSVVHWNCHLTRVHIPTCDVTHLLRFRISQQ